MSFSVMGLGSAREEGLKHMYSLKLPIKLWFVCLLEPKKDYMFARSIASEKKTLETVSRCNATKKNRWDMVFMYVLPGILLEASC
jgi:hypothetical protein